MIKLSDRLQIIADITKDSKTMADIGTDHGFLPVYLLQKGLCRKAIMTDISAPSLEKARSNCRKYLGEDFEGCEFRQGSGLSVLKPGEVENVVIAGMGGRLMVDILSSDKRLTFSFKKFILQPRIGQGILRKWLLREGFSIVREDLVREGNYIPEIITVVSPAFKASLGERAFNFEDYGVDEKNDGEIIYRIPPWISEAGGPAEEFLRRNAEKEKEVIKNVMMSKERHVEAEEIICGNIKYLNKLLERYEDEK